MRQNQFGMQSQNKEAAPAELQILQWDWEVNNFVGEENISELGGSFALKHLKN